MDGAAAKFSVTAIAATPRDTAQATALSDADPANPPQQPLPCQVASNGRKGLPEHHPNGHDHEAEAEDEFFIDHCIPVVARYLPS